MTGRKKIPTQLKKIRGTYAKSRELENEMKVEKVEQPPKPPNWLTKIGKEQWSIVTNELFALGMLHLVDLALVEAYCNAMALHLETEKVCLAIDFIDGDHQNFKLENLRFLCPNCYLSYNGFFPKSKSFCK